MTDYAFRIVNVFAETPLAGNPLCVFESAESLLKPGMRKLEEYGAMDYTIVVAATASGPAFAFVRQRVP